MRLLHPTIRLAVLLGVSSAPLSHSCGGPASTPAGRAAAWTSACTGVAKLDLSGDRSQLRAVLSGVDGDPESAQATLRGLKLEKGRLYTLSFTAHSHAERYLSVRVIGAGKETLGPQHVRATPAGKPFRCVFTSGVDAPDGALTFSLGHRDGTVAVSSLSLERDENPELERRIGPVLPLPEEERFASVPWRVDLQLALREAKREHKPLFLWVMDGFPLDQA